jgi:hypothetical protein
VNYQQTFDDMLEKARQTTVQARKAAEDAARRFGLEDVVRRREAELTNAGRVEPYRDTQARTGRALPVSTARDNAAAEVTKTAAGRTQNDLTARGVSGHRGTDAPTRRDFEGTREMPDRTLSDRTARGVSGRSGADLPPARVDFETTGEMSDRTLSDRTARGVSGRSGADLPPARVDFETTSEMPGRTQNDLTAPAASDWPTSDGSRRSVKPATPTAAYQAARGHSYPSVATVTSETPGRTQTDGFPSRATLRERIARAAAEQGLSRELSALNKVDYDEVTGALETLTRDVRNMDPRKALKTAMASPAAKTAKKFLGPAGVLLSVAVIGDILSDMGDAAAEGDIDALGTGAGDLAEEINPVPGLSLNDVGPRLAEKYGKGVGPGVRGQQLKAEATANRAVDITKAKKAKADLQEVQEDINVLAGEGPDGEARPVTVETPPAKTPAAKKGQSGLLALGARGQAVADLQFELQKLGLLTGGIIKRGTFDNQTKRAVQRLQRQQGIADDGMYGSDTVKALEAAQVAFEPEWIRRARAKNEYPKAKLRLTADIERLKERRAIDEYLHAQKKD